MHVIAAHHSVLRCRSLRAGSFAVSMSFGGVVNWLAEAPQPLGAALVGEIEASMYESTINFLKTEIFAEVSDVASVRTSVEFSGAVEDP